MSVYVVMTPDQFELPMLVTQYLGEVADFTGMPKDAICRQISINASGVRTGYKIMKVEVDDD